MSPAEGRKGRTRPLLLLFAAAALIVLGYVVWQGTERGEGADPGQVPSPPAAPATRETRPDRDAAGDSPAPGEARPAPGESPRDGQPPVPQAHEILAEMRELWECYAAADCSVGEDTDPRAEYFATGERLADGMRTLVEQHRRHDIGDAELAAAAHEVLQYDSGPARAAAIEALGELPPADEHLNALVTVLDQHHDEKLFVLALPELQRYAEGGRRAEVDAFLQSNLRSGAHFPARTIARELGPFLIPENVAGYRALLEALPADSRRARLLRETLREYEMARD